jgi:hypothetical protein
MHTTATVFARRRLTALIGAGVSLVTVLTASACTTQPPPAAPSPTVAASAPNTASGDTSRGADNFYVSDRVDVQKVTFR